MWGRKDPDQQLDAMPVDKPRPTQPAAPVSAPRPVDRPVSKTPSSAQSRIGKSAKFKGDICSDEDLVIDGQVEGGIDISQNTLVIGSTGLVKANVQARSLVIQGELAGKAQVSERTHITATGRLNGDLVTGRIVIEDGGTFRGTSDVRPVKPVSAPKPVPETPAPAPRPAPAVQSRPAVRPTEPPSQRPTTASPQRGIT